MEFNRFKIQSNGTAAGTKIYFVSADGTEAEVKNCRELIIKVSADDNEVYAIMELLNPELHFDGKLQHSNLLRFSEKTDLQKLAELSKAFDSVNSLWVTSVMDLQRTGQRTESQSMQSDILSERLKEIDSEILKISPVRDSPHMCDTCIYDMAVCGSKSIIFGIDMYPNLRGTDADRVIECGLHEQQTGGFAA